MAPTVKNYPDPNVKSAKVEKPRAQGKPAAVEIVTQTSGEAGLQDPCTLPGRCR